MQQVSKMSDKFDTAIAGLRDDHKVLEAPTLIKAQELFAFWKMHEKDGIVIGRDIPSRAVAGLLSSIAIYVPENDGADFRVHLAGTSVRKRFGGEITGERMSDLFLPADFLDHSKALREVLNTGQPLVLDSRLSAGVVEKLHTELVILPVLAPNKIDKWVLVGFFYFR